MSVIRPISRSECLRNVKGPTGPYFSIAGDTTNSMWLRTVSPIQRLCRRLRTCRELRLVLPPITSHNGRSLGGRANEPTTPYWDGHTEVQITAPRSVKLEEGRAANV